MLERILTFIGQRLLVQLKEKGYEHELAALALSVIGRRPCQALRLMEALDEVKDEPWFSDLMTSAVRVRNILQKARTPLMPWTLRCWPSRRSGRSMTRS